VGIEEYFPYETFRPGQRELAERIHAGCLAGEVLLTEAMSGFGKTIAVLCGSLLAAEETGCRVVYACRTKRQILRVVEELARIQTKRRVSAVSLSSKFDYCLLKKNAHMRIPQQSFGWYCGFNVSNNLCSYFLNLAYLGSKVGEAVDELAYRVPTHSSLLKRSEEMHVCPYELVKMAMLGATACVVPYQYVFDNVSSHILFGGGSIDPSKTILVVDEAHNMRDYMRATWSAEMSVDGLDSAANEADTLQMEETASSLRLLSDEVRSTIREAPGWYLDRNAFIERLSAGRGEVWLQNLAFELNSCSSAAWGSVAYERRLPFLILKVGDFVNKLLASPNGTVLTKWEETLRLVRSSPVDDLVPILSRFRSSVLVSATMNPSDVFIRSLGISPMRPKTYSIESTPLVTVKTMIDTGVTTKFKSRTPEMYSRIAAKISAIALSLENGLGVFAPSYAVLEPVHELVSKAVSGRRVVCEAPGLSGSEADDLMEEFRMNRGSVLLAVQGGRFSEGEDFRGEQMDAVVVLGLSLPPPSPQLYAEYAYLKWNAGSDSYLMLSLLPALRKAFQAAGRHLRNPGKRGLVFLFDKRFDSAAVTELMPSWLREDLSKGEFSPDQLASAAASFLGQRID
jgi:DNA excision repair protein ERCC-2